MEKSKAMSTLMSSLQMMLTTRKISTAMTLNGLVYFCQKIPVIGKAVPDTLYGLYGAKTVWVILANLARLMKRLLTKAIYLGSLLASSYFCAVITGGDKNYNVFTDTGRIMTFFFFFSYLAAALAFGKALNLDLGTDLLMIDKMHSDAGKYVPARIYERKIIDFFATIPLAIVLSFSDQYTLWQALLAVFLMTASKLAFESAVLLCFAMLRRVAKIRYRILSILYVGAGILAFLAPFYIVIRKIPFSFKALVFHPAFVIGIMAAAIASVFYINRYTHYRELAWVSVTNYNLALDKRQKEKTRTQFGNTTEFAAKLNKDDLSSDRFSHLSGYAYFNRIFFHRHRRFFANKILWRTLLIGLAVLAAAIFTLTGNLGADTKERLWGISFRILPVCFFILYTLSMGRTATAAMFANCDAAMLSYPFYRDPKVVIPNFHLRLKTILRFNVPAFSLVAVLALMFDLFSRAMTNMDAALINWSMILPYLVTLTMMWLFFSFHDLFIYYILQPYTSELGVKSKLFSIVQGFVWFLAYINLQMSKVNIWIYMAVIIAATAVYLIVGLLCINKFCAKTFRLK